MDGGNLIYSASCPSSSLCIAGDSGGNILSSTNPAAGGSGWSVKNIVAFQIDAVACQAASFCVASDNHGQMHVATDPTGGAGAWSTATVGTGLQAISCPATTLCVGVDAAGNSLISDNPLAGSPTWTLTHIDNNILHAVSCPSTTLCVATDSSGNVLTTTDPAAGTPTWTPTDIDGSLGVYGVSCPSTLLCVAVDDNGDVITSTDPATLTPTWTVAAADGTNALYGMSCASLTLCVATDFLGNVVVSTDPTGGPSAWTVQHVDGNAAIYGISCPTNAVCVATDDPGNVITATAPAHGLTVSLAGTGTGTVSGAGIACPGTCSDSYAQGTQVTLTANPASGSTFGGWSGACSGTGACSVTLDSDRAVTATFDATGGGGGGGAPVAALAAQPAKGGVVLSAAGSTFGESSPASYTFALGTDGKSQVTCPGQDPTVSALVTNAANTVASVTVTAKSGATSTTTTPLALSAPANLPRLPVLKTSYGRTAGASLAGKTLGQVQAVSFECLPAGGNPGHRSKSASVRSVTATDSGPTETNAIATGCFDAVTVGIVQGVGCFTQVDANHPLPAKEAQMLCSYQKVCQYLGDLLTRPPNFFLAQSASGASAAQGNISNLGVDAIYFSTQPVRVDGVEIDPVNGGAIVLARAGIVQSSFWKRDAAYLISSDAVVKIGGLPVSLHVPDYSATYNQAQGAADCAQSVAAGSAGCLSGVKVTPPNFSNLAPSVDGPIRLAVSPEDLGIELGEFTVPKNVLPIPLVPDLPLTGTLKVNLESLDSAQVSVHVVLPGILSDGGGHGLTGDTALTIDNKQGLRLDFLHVSVPSLAQLGLARLKNLDFTYSRPTSLFDGKGTLDLSDVIQGVINAEVVFEHGNFQRSHIDYTANQGAGYPLFGPIFLTYLGADLTLNPTTIAGSGNISVGPAATATGCGAFGANGTAKLVFADPITLDLAGSTQILCANFGYSENFHADSNGDVGYGVGVNYPIPGFGSVSGQLYGQAYADFKRNVFHFQIDGKANANFNVSECADIVGCIGAHFDTTATATFSDIGAGVCAGISINFPDPVGRQTLSVGAGIDNLQKILAQTIASGGALTEAALLQNFHVLTSGCDLSRWRTLPPPAGLSRVRDRGAQASPYSFTLAPGTGTAAIGLQGTGDAPQVVLNGPGGAHVDASNAPDGLSVQGDALVLRQASSGQTLIEMPKAAAGSWTLTPAAGSAPITTVQTAKALPAPSIRAHVTGRGARRTLHYSVTSQPGLAISFLEGVDGGARPLGTARKANGTIAFTPGPGSAKQRTIIAQLVRDGVPGPRQVIARYKPARVRPGRPSHVRVRKTRTGWSITFAPAANATSHLVTIHFADGKQVLLPAGARSRGITVARSIDPTSPSAVEVVGLRGVTRGRPLLIRARRA